MRKRIYNYLNWTTTRQGTLKFTMETYLELFIASLSIIGMKKLQSFTLPDRIAITLQGLCFIYCIAYFVLLLWFSGFKASRIQKARQEEVDVFHRNKEESSEEDEFDCLSDATRIKKCQWKDLKEYAMRPDYKTTDWFKSCELDEKIKVEMLVEMQKTQGDNKALVRSVPEALVQNEEVEPRIQIVEEVKEAADFMNENDSPPLNLVLRDINHLSEEEKKANSSESQSDEDSGFDVNLSIENVANEDEELKIEKLIEMQKIQEDNKTLVSVPEASGQKEKLEP